MNDLRPRAVVRNWRDADGYSGHDNAVIWAIFSQLQKDSRDPSHCLQHLTGFARHALQGGKSADRHQHDGAEQYYYVLAGQAEVVIGDQAHPVREGSVTFFPPATPHQLLAEGRAEWVEYLIITCPTDRRGSAPRVLNWRDARPETGSHGHAVTWQLLERLDAPEPRTDGPCLLAFHYLARQALARGKASDMHQHDDKEQVYYVLEGEGTLVAGFDAHPVREGDAVYLPRGVPHLILNDRCDGWLSYLVVS